MWHYRKLESVPLHALTRVYQIGREIRPSRYVVLASKSLAPLTFTTRAQVATAAAPKVHWKQCNSMLVSLLRNHSPLLIVRRVLYVPTFVWSSSVSVFQSISLYKVTKVQINIFIIVNSATKMMLHKHTQRNIEQSFIKSYLVIVST